MVAASDSKDQVRRVPILLESSQWQSVSLPGSPIAVKTNPHLAEFVVTTQLDDIGPCQSVEPGGTGQCQHADRGISHLEQDSHAHLLPCMLWWNALCIVHHAGLMRDGPSRVSMGGRPARARRCPVRRPPVPPA